jgi:hypothetical protein
MATFYVGKDKVSWNAVMLRIGSYFPYVNGTGVRGIPGDPKHFVHYHSGDDEYKINEKPDSAYNYFGETQINLKYVPKKLKNAEYNSFVDWFKAVYAFIRESKDTASMKSKMKTQQNRTSNQLEFFGVDAQLQDVMNKTGFVPAPLDYWMRRSETAKKNGWTTMNEVNRHHKKLRVQYEKQFDKDRKIELQAEVQRKQTVKLTVQGLDATKMQELISLVMEQLK